MEAFEKLAAVSKELLNPYVSEWKKQGKHVVGYVCSYMPEEILYAADILPFRLTGKGVSDTSQADAYPGGQPVSVFSAHSSAPSHSWLFRQKPTRLTGSFSS